MSRQGLEREVLGRPEQHHSPRPISPLVLDLKRLLTKRQLDLAASRPTRLRHSVRQHLAAAHSNLDPTADIRVPAISTRLADQQLASPNDSKRPLGQTRIRRRQLPVERNLRIDSLDRLTTTAVRTNQSRLVLVILVRQLPRVGHARYGHQKNQPDLQ